MSDEFNNEVKIQPVANNKFEFADFINFDKFVTPLIIKILYFIGLLLIIVSVFTSTLTVYYMTGGFVGIILSVLYFLVAAIISALILRISIEMVLVIFDIRKNLVEINRKSK